MAQQSNRQKEPLTIGCGLRLGHSLATAACQPSQRPVFKSHKSPLLARLQQFLPALQSANKSTLPRTTIEEVKEPDDDVPAVAAESGTNQSEPNTAEVQMEVILVPHGSTDASAKAMVDMLADETDDSTQIESSPENEKIHVSLEIDSGSPKPLNPGIRVVESSKMDDKCALRTHRQSKKRNLVQMQEDQPRSSTYSESSDRLLDSSNATAKSDRQLSVVKRVRTKEPQENSSSQLKFSE